MCVRKLFWEDPYLRQINASVANVDADTITLDRTIVYAFSGGQASDSGTINDYEIIEAVKSGKEIFYKIQPDHSLKVGDEVIVRIDWEKRYKIMRLHFAAELILELVYQNFGRPEKIGANIMEDKARVDFAWKGNISETFPLLEREAGGIIRSDLNISSRFSDEEEEKRYWEIEGFAKVSCGGTHIKKTGEVGSLTLKRKNLGGNKERIEILLNQVHKY